MKELLLVCSELPPFTPAGDHGETVAGLAQSLRASGLTVNVVTLMRPDVDVDRYGFARRLEPLELVIAGQREKVVLFEGKFPASDARVVLLDHPRLLHEEPPAGEEAERAFARHVLLAAGTMALVERFGWSPDVVHAFGWQTGLLPLLLQQRPPEALAGAKRVFTVFDPAEKGLFDPAMLERYGIGFDLFHPDGIEFHQQGSLLKAGLVCADRITVAGPSAAVAYQREELGFGLHGLYARLADRLHGVLGGVEPSAYDPEKDPRLVARFAVNDLAGKASCRRAAEIALGLKPDHKRPLVLLWRADASGAEESDRGIDALLEGATEWLPLGVRLAIIGPVTKTQSGRMDDIIAEHPQALAHRAEVPTDKTAWQLLAGGDVLLLPADRDTGCLLQLKAMRYGTAPAVPADGALGDYVVDFDPTTSTGTGFTFEGLETEALLTVMRRIAEAHVNRQRWRTLVTNAMRQDWSWELAAMRMRQVYEAGAGSAPAEHPTEGQPTEEQPTEGSADDAQAPS